MKTIAEQIEENFSSAAFKAVVIYDDIGCAGRAVAVLERVADRADKHMKCDVKLWRLDALWQPSLAAITNAVAADANLILFALGGIQPLREELLNWLELWSANRRIKDVAVGLFGPEADAATPLRSELERCAWRRGLAFLAADEAWDGDIPTAGFRPQSHWNPAAEPEPLPVVEPVPATNRYHWGIND